MTKNHIFGLSAAIVTPYSADGSVDLNLLAKHASDILARGCDSITLFGTTGEGYGLSLEERDAMLSRVVTLVPEGKRLFAGVMATAIPVAVAQARQALAAGAAGLLIVPPFFMKSMSDDGIFAWYSAVFDGTGSNLRNVILYHIPGQSAVSISTELVSRLRAAYPGVITAIKDSSGDPSTGDAFLATHGDLSVLFGDERQLPVQMAKGGEGSICGFANISPELMADLIHRGGDGRVVKQAVDLILSFPIIPAVKALVGHLSGDSSFDAVRPPLVPLTPQQKNELTKAFDSIITGS